MNGDKNIKVDYLCSQPFWNFTKKSREEFCKVCRHSITDFSDLSTDEILDKLKNAKGKTCGTFYPDQFIINEQTRRSPPVYQLVFASAFTFLVSTFSSRAQQVISEPVKTEQHYTTKELNEIYPVCFPDSTIQDYEAAAEEIKKYKRNRGLKLFRIGRSTFYLSSRFPFIRRYRMHRGKVISSFESGKF